MLGEAIAQPLQAGGGMLQDAWQGIRNMIVGGANQAQQAWGEMDAQQRAQAFRAAQVFLQMAAGDPVAGALVAADEL